MRGFARRAFAVMWKDLAIERRSKETLNALTFFSLLLPVTGWFLLTAAKAEERSAITEVGLGGMTVQDVVLYGVARASADTDTETMLFQRSRLGLPKMVAVETDDGSISGLVAVMRDVTASFEEMKRLRKQASA